MPWTTEQKTFAVEAYFEQKSTAAVQLRFRRRFQCRDVPCQCHRSIYQCIQKFRTHGTVLNLHAKGNRDIYSGRPKRSRTPENIALVRDSVVRSPSKSLRCRNQQIGMKRESVRRILVNGLHLYPYHIQIKQRLTPEEMRKRVIMCQWFCDKIDEDPDFLDDVWFSDEAYFLVLGHVNSKNNIFWGSAPPDHCLQRPLHSTKCTA
ncbi:transposable element tc3 transposase [Plakobranchus ocellatus]|uniref:Transposable element tc3 transposase n=1 Tax=Plakobranchus ocellatus TaxID=259542 RepID=A0AAV3XFB4_9GAST|nr:transposable element tc3 transposase [Plakobranchus ocellatus]